MLTLDSQHAKILYVLMGVVAGLFLAFGLAVVSWNDAGGRPSEQPTTSTTPPGGTPNEPPPTAATGA